MVSTDELIVDTAEPVVTIDRLFANSGTPTLTGSVGEAGATISVQVDGVDYAATNHGAVWSATVGPISDGAYSVAVTATDAAGNVGTDVTVDELVVDTVAPVATVDLSVTNDTTPELTGSVVDDNPPTEVTVTVDGFEYSAGVSDGSWTLTDGALPALPDGIYEVMLTATDQAGNVGSDLTVSELTIDTDEPAVTLDTLLTNKAAPTLTGSVDDADAAITVTVDGVDYAATNEGATWTATVGPLSDGTYDVMVSATDPAGNTGTDSTANELAVDTTEPRATVNPPLTNRAELTPARRWRSTWAAPITRPATTGPRGA